MKDKPLFDLENQFEADLISQILTAEGIPFRIDPGAESYWGVVMGSGINMFMPYAKLWGYVDDKQKIGELLKQMRSAEPSAEDAPTSK